MHKNEFRFVVEIYVTDKDNDTVLVGWSPIIEVIADDEASAEHIATQKWNENKRFGFRKSDDYHDYQKIYEDNKETERAKLYHA